jgi:hypothetical protein
MKAFLRGLIRLLYLIIVSPIALITICVVYFIGYLQYFGGQEYTLIHKMYDFIESKKRKNK